MEPVGTAADESADGDVAKIFAVLKGHALSNKDGQIVFRAKNTVQIMFELESAGVKTLSMEYHEHLLSLQLKVGKLFQLIGLQSQANQFFDLQGILKVLRSLQVALTTTSWDVISRDLLQLRATGMLPLCEHAASDVFAFPEKSQPSFSERQRPARRKGTSSGSHTLSDEQEDMSQHAQDEEGQGSSSGGPGSRKRQLEEERDQLVEEYQRRFGGLSWTELLKLVVDKDRQLADEKNKSKAKDEVIESLRKKGKLLQQQTRRAKTTSDKLQEKQRSSSAATAKAYPAGKPAALHSGQAEKKLSVEQKMAIVRTGKHGTGRYLTIPARISLGIRRNLSNVACGDLSLILLDDASRWSVARAEVHSAAAMTASCKSFHLNMVESFDSSDPSLSIHLVTQDATNSSIWQKRKLCALICHTAYLAEPMPTDQEAKEFTWSWQDLFHSLQCVADVQQVQDGNAYGCVALCEKMLRSVGCPSIHTLVSKYQNDPGTGMTNSMFLGRLYCSDLVLMFCPKL